MPGIWIALLIAAVLALSYAHWIEPARLRVRLDTLPIPRLPAAMDGFSIAFFSDLHAATPADIARIASIVERVNAEEPDIVLIGGDIARNRATFSETATVLSRLRSTHGTFVARGNHDVDRGESFFSVFAAHGIAACRNASYPLRHNGAPFHLAILDDYLLADTRPDIALNGLSPEDFVIALAHEPRSIRQIARESLSHIPSIALTGHTHGGQITLFGLYSPLATRPLPGFSTPWRTLGSIPTLYSNGVGQLLPLRFCAPPTLHFITLRSVL